MPTFKMSSPSKLPGPIVMKVPSLSFDPFEFIGWEAFEKAISCFIDNDDLGDCKWLATDESPLDFSSAPTDSHPMRRLQLPSPKPPRPSPNNRQQSTLTVSQTPHGGRESPYDPEVTSEMLEWDTQSEIPPEPLELTETTKVGVEPETPDEGDPSSTLSVGRAKVSFVEKEIRPGQLKGIDISKPVSDEAKIEEAVNEHFTLPDSGFVTVSSASSPLESKPPISTECKLNSTPSSPERSVGYFQSGRDKKRRLTFRMDEVPQVATLQTQPEIAISRVKQVCGDALSSESTPSFDGEWQESQMDLPVRKTSITAEKFDIVLLDELKRANDESDKLAFDIFSGEPPAIEETCLPDQETHFDIARLRHWFHTVADVYAKGVRLVKVTMEGQKVIRTIKVDDDFFHVSLPNGEFRHTHLCYVEKASIGWASGEFMRLIEITEQGTEVPLQNMCLVVRMPSRSVSLVCPSEVVRNELLLLIRVKIRIAKYNFGDGTLAVLRANTCGTLLKKTKTLLGGTNAEEDRNSEEETDESGDESCATEEFDLKTSVEDTNVTKKDYQDIAMEKLDVGIAKEHSDDYKKAKVGGKSF